MGGTNLMVRGGSDREDRTGTLEASGVSHDDRNRVSHASLEPLWWRLCHSEPLPMP